MGIHDVPKDELIERTAQELKKINEIKPPEWTAFVKTGVHKERPPVRRDWWYIRTASVLRKLSVYGPVGVSKLRVKYGGKKNRGVRPGKFYKGSGNITRKILQQLEKAGLAKKNDKGVHKGRVAASKGLSLLEKISAGIMKERGIVIPRIPKEKLKIEEKKPKKTRKRTVKKKVGKPKEVKEKKVEVPKVEEKKSEVKVEKSKIEEKVEEKPTEEKKSEVKKE